MKLSMLRVGLPLLAAGLLIFALTTSLAYPDRPDGTPPIEPARSPFADAVAGTGTVEPNSELIAIAPHIGGIIETVHVRVNQRVRKGTPLFTLDRRDAQARLAVEEARLAALRVAAADAARQHDLYRTIGDPRAVSRDELDKRRYAAEAAEKAVLESTARIEVTKTELTRLTVHSPIDGTILRVSARAGEYAAVGKLREALITLGNVEPLHLRVEIDETDAVRFSAEAPAFARARGHGTGTRRLKFVRSEPLLTAKRTLTGDGNERIDTRVLEVIYAIEDAGFSARVGQQLDVFIRAQPRTATAQPAQGGRS